MNFKDQIDEDIEEYKRETRGMDKIQDSSWAFNYWVLDKLFYVDQEIIESQIIDYHDLGIDAYVFYEDTCELYLIQNKYYSEDTTLQEQYVKDDFLLKPINSLQAGTYTHSEILQNIFKKNKLKDNFRVHLELYVTNNNIASGAMDRIHAFNRRRDIPVHCDATIYSLEDIKDKYYGAELHKIQNFTTEIASVVRGTVLTINTEAYKLKNIIDARYVFTPIITIYKMYRDAKEKGYPIFDKNIREYLGRTATNKNIVNTLQDDKERENFFYYNNGITIICDKMNKITPISVPNSNIGAKFTIQNPQVVNGCQTVNSIYSVLENYAGDEALEKEFKDTFVMVKILEIDRTNDNEEKLYKNIVRFNNSQNAINERDFTSNNRIFGRVQDELEKKGFCLLVRQSDKNKFQSKYKQITKLKAQNNKYFEKYRLSCDKLSDCFIKLEKLMQVIVAFKLGGYDAYTKKSSLLKTDSEMYRTVISFLKDDEVTTETLLNLYLLYAKAENGRKNSSDLRSPIPYYLIDCFGYFDCNNREPNNILNKLEQTEKIDEYVELYKRVTKAYQKQYLQDKEVDYNKMIKQKVDYDKLRDHISVYKE
jgi:hypothetical protein